MTSYVWEVGHGRAGTRSARSEQYVLISADIDVGTPESGRADLFDPASPVAAAVAVPGVWMPWTVAFGRGIVWGCALRVGERSRGPPRRAGGGGGDHARPRRPRSAWPPRTWCCSLRTNWSRSRRRWRSQT